MTTIPKRRGKYGRLIDRIMASPEYWKQAAMRFRQLARIRKAERKADSERIREPILRGTIVTLKTGGPVMVVTKVEGDVATCKWRSFLDRGAGEGEFPAAMLRWATQEEWNRGTSFERRAS